MKTDVQKQIKENENKAGFSLKMKKSTYDEFKKICIRENISMNKYINTLIENEIDSDNLSDIDFFPDMPDLETLFNFTHLQEKDEK